MKESGQTLHDIRKGINIFPQKLINVSVNRLEIEPSRR